MSSWFVVHLKHELSIRVSDILCGDLESCYLLKAIPPPNDRVSYRCFVHFSDINNHCCTCVVRSRNKLLHRFRMMSLWTGSNLWQPFCRFPINPVLRVTCRPPQFFWYRFSMCTRYLLIPLDCLWFVAQPAKSIFQINPSVACRQVKVTDSKWKQVSLVYIWRYPQFQDSTFEVLGCPTSMLECRGRERGQSAWGNHQETNQLLFFNAQGWNFDLSCASCHGCGLL